ncbi:patatin-like phospholipase family protein [Kineococcus rhizosphaerae]|uniref:Patatin-like phospholipase n=1 Tax=Kineococcus rhizosphaerae TaxID=559628 RepID=A0A2T0QZP4_9ACTN|nr:patatin-like phospholipase family protein [Kineococcus rhizosphaerae]PRY12095.1 patatin-like phospholipase [Kineococcus rhizosphaerae]
MTDGPEFECDLVLKGGVTSGLVYPSAVVRIARTHRFRSIGGSSAGALAAVLAAAAELGRGSGGFERLAEVPAQMAAVSGGRSGLLALFRPQPGTRELLDLALLLRGAGRVRTLLGHVGARGARTRGFAVAAVAALAVLAGVLALVAGADTRAAVAAGVSSLLLALVVVAGAALGFGARAVLGSAPGRLDDNLFGLCTGLGGTPQEPALGEYLHTTVQHLAGREQPVTYGDLATAGIRLVTTTTNVSQGESSHFPLTRGVWAYRPEQWRRLLPPEVMEFLASRPPAADVAPEHRATAAAAGLVLLPAAEDLPIWLGARISLSFPVLLSAVPLWTWAPTGSDPQGPARWVECWFSDGGITSNLPVHLFDSPLPSRPTYAVNLVGGADPASPVAQRVFRPVASSAATTPPVAAVGTVRQFLAGVYDTMHNWADESQARVPGVRERICTVRLADDQGGLNLDMGPERIAALVRLGEAAGAELAGLRERSGPDPASVVGDEWNRHRYLRLRCLVAGTGLLLDDVRPRWRTDYPELARVAATEDPFPQWGRWDEERTARSSELLDDLLARDVTAWTQQPPPASRLTRRTLHDDLGGDVQAGAESSSSNRSTNTA